MRVRYQTLAEFRKEAKEFSYGFTESPFGLSLLVSYGDELLGYGFSEVGGEQSLLLDYQERWEGQGISFREDAKKARQQSQQIFSSSPPSLLLLGTTFQHEVWKALIVIKKGESMSYGELASQIGHQGAARAVGTAIGRNPVSLLVPCHRVRRADGGLGGYHWGVERKKQILAWEQA